MQIIRLPAVILLVLALLLIRSMDRKCLSSSRLKLVNLLATIKEQEHNILEKILATQIVQADLIQAYPRKGSLATPVLQ